MYFFSFGVLLCAGLSFLACSIDSSQTHYKHAEKLWLKEKYAASVSEFEKAIQKNPKSPIALKASIRAAQTQSWFLFEHEKALKTYQRVVELGGDPKIIWYVELQIGDILYSKLELYNKARKHYQRLLKSPLITPNDAPLLLYRLAKIDYYNLNFNNAINILNNIIKEYPDSIYTEKSYFDLAANYFTLGQRDNSLKSKEYFKLSLSAYEKFIQNYPNSSLISQAKFEIGSCLEELDCLSEAYATYKSIENTHPSPQLVVLKLNRILKRTEALAHN